MEVRRPFAFFLRALPLRSRDLRILALSAALRRAVLRRGARVFIVISLDRVGPRERGIVDMTGAEIKSFAAEVRGLGVSEAPWDL